jgi:hypothetical protein
MSDSTNTFKIEVLEVVDNEDGSCRVVFDLDHSAIIKFAKIGLVQTLLDAAKLAEIQHGLDTDVGC